MQVVDVLRDDLDIERALQSGYGRVRRIGLRREQLFSPLVVELHDQRAVARQRFGRAYVFDTIIRPKAVGVAERRQSAVGADARAREYHYFLHKITRFNVTVCNSCAAI